MQNLEKKINKIEEEFEKLKIDFIKQNQNMYLAFAEIIREIEFLKIDINDKINKNKKE